MARLTVTDLAFRFPQASVENISFTVEQGQVACLLGASGSGKTTILKLITGFLRPAKGSIHIGEQLVATPATIMPAEKRGVGLVFQQHALFPHLTVGQNILFGCREPSPAREQLLAQLLADFHIPHYADRYPHELSGGEQQRVALARALAAKPEVMLMDEPFASIDSVLRRKIRTECIDVLRKAGVTTLIVTHDAEEAMELADQILVIEQGKLVQAGSASQVYYQPVSANVGGLFGDINHITDPAIASTLGGSAPLLVRPEQLVLAADGLEGTITHIYFRGSYHTLQVAITPELSLKVQLRDPAQRVGDTVRLRLA